MTKELSSKIIKALKNHYGKINPSLRRENIYQLTIAVILSAQTTDLQVNSVTPKLFKRYPDFKSLSEAKLKDVEEIIRSTGFFRNKSKNIIQLSKIVTKKYKNAIPNRLDELIKLPGIGRKTANVILSMGFGIPAFAVDTHIKRIANRLKFTDSKKPILIEKALTALIPENKWKDAHILLITHGRKTCRAKKPLCSRCPVNQYCVSFDKIH